MESWVKIAAQSVVEGEGQRRISILGNLYSVERGLASAADSTGANSGAKGHFGYGLYCDLQIPDGRWTCTMTVSIEGSDRGGKCNTLFHDIPSEQWTHLAGSYDEETRSLAIVVNGVESAVTTCGEEGLGQILYEPPDPAVYLTEQATGEGLIVPGLPTLDMGFAGTQPHCAPCLRFSAESCLS